MIDLTLYNYILINPNLTIDYCDVCSERTTSTYASNSAIVTAIKQVKTDYSYLGGIIPTGSNTEYVINVTKVKYYEQQLTFLYLRFANDYELRIDCSTNALALESYNVIDCIYRALNEATIYTNRVQWYVKEGITDSVTMKSFSDIQTAVTYLQNNGLSENAQVIVRSGTYNSFVVSSSLMFKFESNVTIAGGTVIQSLSNVNKSDAIYYIQNSDNENYYSPAIYVNNNLLLYAKMTDRALTFYYSDKTQAYSFLSYDTYLGAYEQYIESSYRQIATIGSSDNYVYLLNLALVTSHSIASLNINVTFSTGDTLAISCISSDDALFNDNYIGKIYTSYNIDDYLATKNILYVNPHFPSDTATQFQTIAGALSASVNGNLIYIENATHTASNLVLKDGIDLYCDRATINCTANNLFIDTSAVNVNIFGTAKITTTDINSQKGLPLFIQYGSEIYFEFDTINTSSAGTYSYSTVAPSSLIVKGYSIVSVNHGIDSDGNMAVYDVDVLHITSTGNCFYPIATVTTPVYFRNTKGTSTDALGGIYLDSQQYGYDFNGINMRIINNAGTPYTITYGLLSNINLWNCFFQTTQDYSIDCNYDTQVITAKNNIYAGKTYGNSITVSGDFTLKPYLNLN